MGDWTLYPILSNPQVQPIALRIAGRYCNIVSEVLPSVGRRCGQIGTYSDRNTAELSDMHLCPLLLRPAKLQKRLQYAPQAPLTSAPQPVLLLRGATRTEGFNLVPVHLPKQDDTVSATSNLAPQLHDHLAFRDRLGSQPPSQLMGTDSDEVRGPCQTRLCIPRVEGAGAAKHSRPDSS